MLKHEVLENMKNIVDNCMGEEKAACVATCPMHTDVKSYVRLIKEEKGKEAIKVIREKLFIPGILGRICAHPCEAKCKWNEAKNPISIASLKRFAADNFDDESDWDMSIKESNGKSVAIIGAGPSGLQAALDLRKEGCEVTVFEKLPVRGGMMAVGIPAYRLPREIIEKEVNYLDKLGVKFEMNFEVGKDREFSDIVNSFDSTIVAVGKHQGRVDRSLENFDAKGIFSAQGFLKEASLTGKVIESGKKVLVVGGGDVAMDCSRTARRLTETIEVNSICLEDSFNTMASSDHEIQGAKAEGIFFNHAKAIKTIKVDENGRVSSVILKRCLSMFDAQGRFAPSFDESEVKEIEVDTIIFAIGQGVEGVFAKDILVQRPNSTFECDKQTLQSSSNEKVFICGDASGESVIVIQAMATGRRAAQSVIRLLNNEDLTEGREISDTWTFETKLKREVDWNKSTEIREDMQEVSVEERVKSFDEVAKGYTFEEAKKESDRCKQCQCKVCMSECIMLNEYTECPKTLFKEYLDKGIENMDKMIAYSCNECNQCTIACPKSLDLKSNFRFVKENLSIENKGLVPLEELKPSDAIQEKECDEEYCTTVEAKTKEERVEMENNIPKKKTKYVFVPGCTIPAYTPEGVENTLKHLRDSLGAENVGAMLQCCGKVTYLIGENERYEVRNKKANDILDDMGAEVIITVCPSCYSDFSKTAKGKRVISYWDLMKNLIGIPDGAKGVGENSDVVFNIHDSCVTRDVISHHESVRWILDELGYKWSEVERNGKSTRCCGVGGMVCSSKPKLYKEVYERRAKDFDSDHIVTYCGSCRGTMQAAGKDAIHILDLMFGKETYMASDAKARGYVTEEEMWANRLETKTRLENLK